MPLSDPRRAVLVILQSRGPQTAEYLERHVEGAAALLPAIEGEGLIAQREGGVWEVVSRAW